jgi:hypothetical protein
LAVYHHHRLEVIRTLVWESRASGKGMRPPPNEIKNNLSNAEEKYWKGYSAALYKYKSNFLTWFDVTSSDVPPSTNLIQVRCIKSLEFKTFDNRCFKMSPGEMNYVSRSDVENFIQLGYLIHIKDNF